MKFLLLFLAGFSVAFGQTPAVKPTPPHVNIKFTLVGWGQEVTGLKYRQSGSLKETNTIPLFTRSKSFEYSGPASLEFYREAVAGAKKTQDNEHVVATAIVPAGLKRVMILLAPQDDHYRALVVPDDLDNVPAGQALMMNLSDSNIAVRINKTEMIPLAPGAGKLIGPGKRSPLLVQLEIGIQKDTIWEKSDNCFLPLPIGYQTMVFFLKSDSDYFKDMDGRVLKPAQMIVLREPIEAPPQSAAVATH